MFNIDRHRITTIPKLLEKMGRTEDVESTGEEVKVGDLTLNFRIFHPESPETEMRDILPTFLYIPATGFNTMISPGWDKIICSHLAKKSGYQIIALYHRLAPENPFPAALKDICALTKGIIKNAARYKIDENNVVFGGYSSGGNLAAVTSEILAKDQISIKALYLICPMLDLSRSIKGEYDEYEKCDRFPEELVKWMIDMYARKTNRKNGLLSPFWSKNLQSLPNIIRLFVGENDRFRGDVEMFAKKLNSTNKCVTDFVFRDSTHVDFWYKIKNLETVIKFLMLDNVQIPRDIIGNTR